MQTVLVSCIGKKIPRWFLTHSSKSLQIRPIWSSSIKMAAEEDYTFGPYKIHHTEVFYSTHLSYAMVNLRPLLPGHVLVCPKREVKRFVDLTGDETSDLWLTAQKVGKQLESYHKASSLTLAIQMDEKEKELKQKLDLDKERKDRTLDEMSQEADEYRKLFV
ncbi:bifunctional bis(5'-adenosyl)-triphosphatase/adenylylsulfatase FHIT isoform X2 [Vigna umbellata]|uniref:bifunctional bis(5'-adenosyl)-triphosphatase/adenylylsulfatase FHIT isoform X2 n=1 Tax=Vigna umbellata TaxID=87088 RepID=UPI001F5FA23C|nr:bifunctional bis(5'-adenosyl)-triphosphatase/adenylylsulfatase FHIT isoform X2 [Vigna umbellata]